MSLKTSDYHASKGMRKRVIHIFDAFSVRSSQLTASVNWFLSRKIRYEDTLINCNGNNLLY